MSSNIFLFVIEVLAIYMIGQATYIKGIHINNNEHKIIQYADDATICVTEESSIDKFLEVIDKCSLYAQD